LTVAERAGRVAGFTYLGPHDPEEPDSAGPDVGELYAIHLDPAEQGRGVGRALMIDALATLHARGWRRAVLWVLADNTHAQDFYARGGWTADGIEREGDIGPTPTRQLRYVRELP
jgi:ribosomal protein S18 acetylase RimI-like enzyme